MPILSETKYTFGPGVSFITLSSSSGSPGSNFLFESADITYGINYELMIPANFVNPLLFLKEPVGTAAFRQVITTDEFLTSLAASGAQSFSAGGLYLSMSIRACTNNSTVNFQSITLQGCFPIQYRIQASKDTFLTLSLVAFLFFRMSTS